MPIFTASHISEDSNVVYPDRLEIDPDKVIFFKGRAFGYERVIIAQHNITSVYLATGIWFSDVVIETAGGRRLVAGGFPNAVAETILHYILPYY